VGPPELSFLRCNRAYNFALDHDDLKGAVAVIREAYLADARGVSVNPSSLFLRFPDKPNDRIMALPS
jgi:hypothetical protein